VQLLTPAESKHVKTKLLNRYEHQKELYEMVLKKFLVSQ